MGYVDGKSLAIRALRQLPAKALRTSEPCLEGIPLSLARCHRAIDSIPGLARFREFDCFYRAACSSCGTIAPSRQRCGGRAFLERVGRVLRSIRGRPSTRFSSLGFPDRPPDILERAGNALCLHWENYRGSCGFRTDRRIGKAAKFAFCALWPGA